MLQAKIDDLGKQLATLLSRGNVHTPHTPTPYSTPGHSVLAPTPSLSPASLSTPAASATSLSTPSDSPFPNLTSLPTVAHGSTSESPCALPSTHVSAIPPLPTALTPLSSSPVVVPLVQTPSVPTTMRTLVLGDGSTLQYTVDEIPDPPTTTFTDLNFPRLNRMWDDAPGSSWDNSSTLIIRGRSIAAKYWPEVYRYGKPRQWEGLKGKWGDWQVCHSYV